MKIFFKIIIGIIVVIIISMMIIPTIFKSKLQDIVEKEINKQINAQVSFEDMDLSFFKQFPSLTFSIEKLQVIGNPPFENDTLCNIQDVLLNLNLFDLLSGNQYEVDKISLVKGDFNIRILKDGQANYDISLSDYNSEIEEVESSNSSIIFKINELILESASLDYIDKSINMEVFASDINQELSGLFGIEKSLMTVHSDIEFLDVNYEGVNYLRKTNVRYDAEIEADISQNIYHLKENQLLINQLPIIFSGSVTLGSDHYNIKMNFNSPEGDMKNFLSLIPELYSKDFDKITASGQLKFTGNIDGIYSETSYPTFSINLNIDEGSFSYPDLPSAVNDVFVDMNINNQGSDLDEMVIKIAECRLNLGDDPFNFSLELKTPISDPDMMAMIKGNINLENIDTYYPMEGEQISGVINTDIFLEGKLSDLENENYENFIAKGFLEIEGFNYFLSDYQQDLVIKNGRMEFTPQFFNIDNCDLNIGQNDLLLKGRIENFLSYYFHDKDLKGQFQTSSSFFNLNDFMTESLTEPEVSENQENPSSIYLVPAHIDFKLTSNFYQLIYDSLLLKNTTANIHINKETVFIEDLKTNTLDGLLNASGSYSTINPSNPDLSLALNISNISIPQASQNFEFVKHYFPFAKKTVGNMTTNLKFNSKLGDDMIPVFSSIDGGGDLFTTKLTLDGITIFDKIADFLKIDELKSLALNKVKIVFEIIEGKVFTKPFDFNVKDINGNMGGWTNFDREINYLINLNIPSSKFSGSGENVLNDLMSQAKLGGNNFELGNTIPVSVEVTGFITDPQFSVGLSNFKDNLIEDIKETIEKTIEEKKEEISKEIQKKMDKILADAEKSANSIIEQAEIQAANVVKEAEKSANKIRSEADVQATNLIKEAKKKGYIAELAARKTAEELKKEADKQADNLVNSAKAESNNIINKAKQSAENIRKNAREKADNLKK